ncbi:MAG: Bug family tripartite tricarboxylate transporter substrate binding protein [Burkholderiales bacterium]
MNIASYGGSGRVALIAGLLLCTPYLGVEAQEYPSKPVRVINPYSTGGPSDFLGRLINEKLQAGLGQPFVTEYRIGAAGNVGTAAVARAVPDGYTLVMNVDFTLGTNPVLYQNPGFDPLKDLAPVSLIAKSKSVLVVHPSTGVNTVQELIALAKVKPLSFASGSNGTPGHLSGELFKQVTGVDMLHVPYKGNPPAVAATIAGETQVFIAALPTMLPHIKSGRVKALVMANLHRDTTLPDVPSAAEAGVPGIEVDSWFALSAPARTPKAIIDRLHREIAGILRMPDIRERMLNAGLEPAGQPGEEVTRLI